MKHISVLLLVCFFSVQSIAQFTYERNYPSNNRGHIVVDVEPTGGGYYLLSLIRDTTKLDYIYGVNLLEMEIKGGVKTSKDYIFSDSIKVISAGGLTKNENGSLLFSVDLDTIDLNKVLVSVESGLGNIQWAQKYGTTARDTSLASIMHPTDVFMTDDENLLHMTTIVDTLMTSLYMSNVDTFGLQNWARTLDYVEENNLSFDEEWGGTTQGLNNNLVSAGQILTDTNFVFVTEFSNVGLPTWARKYRFDGNDASNLKVADIVRMSDNTYMLTGTVVDSSDMTIQKGFVIAIDTLGEYIWSKTLDFAGTTSNVYINSAIEKSDTSILVSLKAHEINTPLLAYVAEIGQTGTIVWQNKYKYASESGIYDGAIRKTSDNGYAYALTGSEQSNDELMYLIKTDEAGATRCHEAATELSLSPLFMTADTANWTLKTFTGQDSIMVHTSIFNKFDVPAITLDNLIFCPNELIDTLVDVTIPEASAYVWGSDANGETTPTLRITAEGSYSVEVTIDTLYCYTLCDTTKVSRKDLPTVDIIFDNQWCNSREFILTATSNNPIISNQWSNNVTNQSLIRVSEIGTYSVTITDDCGDTAVKTIEIGEENIIPEDEIEIIPTSLECFSPTTRLQVVKTDDPNSTSPGFSNIMWSTEENNVRIIRVSETGNYSVTLTDDCNYTVDANINLLSLNDPLPLPTLSTTGFDTYCDEGIVNIQLNNADKYASILWSYENQTGSSIFIESPGEYSVTVEDQCGESQTVSITIAPEDFPACPCLEYPNIFTPGITTNTEADSLNVSFGPHNKCDDSLITDYEMVIYNRWGNQVFQTTRLNERWNGTHNNDPAPSEVYLFYARFVNSEETFEVKGNVTLLR